MDTCVPRARQIRSPRLGRASIAALILGLIATLAMTSAVMACSTEDLKITLGCQSGSGATGTRTWHVTNTYTSEGIAWSINSSFSGATQFASNAGGTVQTSAAVDTLYVRFVTNTGVKISKAWTGDADDTCPLPDISTSLSGGGQTGASITVPIGTSVQDTETVTAGLAPSVVPAIHSVPTPTGTVAFTYYTSSDCATGAQTAGSAALSSGQATSSGIVFGQAGKYYWKAVYGGDQNYSGVTSACTEEVVTVEPNDPTIATTLSGTSVQVGSSVHDSAALTGATSNAGGTVQYTVYTDSECTLGPIDAGLKAVSDGIVTDSNPITFNSAGTWYWQAVYSGDANNTGATSTCTEEVLTVLATPIPTPTPTPSATPVATPTPTPTPFQTVLGETSEPSASTTPPPTSTGSNGSSNNSTPLFALLICLAFGGLGLAAVEAQRRTIRR